MGTTHGICASAIHPIEARYGYEAVRNLFCSHIRENKKPVIEAFKRSTDGMCQLSQKYIEMGLDGVYYETFRENGIILQMSEDLVEPYDNRFYIR